MGSQENSSAKERIQTIHSVKFKDFFYKLGGWFLENEILFSTNYGWV
jgi:hypothetical protein